MKIRIDHGKMGNVTKKLDNSANELMKEINNIEKQIGELKTIWQGAEANIFYIKIDNYLMKMKAIPKTYESMSRFLQRANIMYKEADIELKKAIEDIRMNG